MQLKALTMATVALVLASARSDATEIANGSFESGNFSGWIVEDLSVPFVPLNVGGAALTPGFGLFVSAPTDGSFAALHGFDGDGPGTIRIAQDIAVTSDGSLVEFDYRAGWNLITYCFGCSDRVFTVNVEPAGGGSPLLSVPILRARAGTTNLDTGDQVGAIDLGAFAGQTVRLSFDFFVPDFHSGPAFFQLDNVHVAQDPWIASGAVRTRQLGQSIRWKHIVGLRDSGNSVGTGGGRLRGAIDPWTTEETGEGVILDLQREVLTFGMSGLSLAGGNKIGTTGGLRAVRGTLICDTDGSVDGNSVLVDTAPVPLDRNGRAVFNGPVGPLPRACAEPDIAFVIRPVGAPTAASGRARARPDTAVPSRVLVSPEYPPRSGP